MGESRKSVVDEDGQRTMCGLGAEYKKTRAGCVPGGQRSGGVHVVVMVMIGPGVGRPSAVVATQRMRLFCAKVRSPCLVDRIRAECQPERRMLLVFVLHGSDQIRERQACVCIGMGHTGYGLTCLGLLVNRRAFPGIVVQSVRQASRRCEPPR